MLHTIREVFQYKSMMWSLVTSELRTRYKGSVLGFLWTFVNPLLTLIVYSVIFITVMRVNLPHYVVFLFMGLLSWNFFATTLQSSANVVIGKSALVKKIYFPRVILPLSLVGAGLINYLLSLIVLIPFLLINGYFPTWLWLIFPLILLVQTLLIAGFSMLFAAVNVFFRDLEHMLGIFLMLWFYLTPIVYAFSMIPARYSQFFKVNPMTDVILSIQDIFYYHQPLHWKLFLYACIFSVGIFVIGWTVYDRLGKRFAEEV